MKGLDTLAPKEIDIIAETRTRQVINDGGQQIQEIAPQIIQGAIEDIYKTPFRLLGQLGKYKFSQLKKKLSRLIKKWTIDKEMNIVLLSKFAKYHFLLTC